MVGVAASPPSLPFITSNAWAPPLSVMVTRVPPAMFSVDTVGDTPSVPSCPSAPGAPSWPGSPFAPGAPSLPGAPFCPSCTVKRWSPVLSVMVTVWLPSASSTCTVGEKPSAPSAPGLPSLPGTPGAPSAPGAPGAPSLPSAPFSPRDGLPVSCPLMYQLPFSPIVGAVTVPPSPPTPFMTSKLCSPLASVMVTRVPPSMLSVFTVGLTPASPSAPFRGFVVYSVLSLMTNVTELSSFCLTSTMPVPTFSSASSTCFM